MRSPSPFFRRAGHGGGAHIARLRHDGALFLFADTTASAVGDGERAAAAADRMTRSDGLKGTTGQQHTGPMAKR